ncbi:O-methyltransferase [Nakamurella sp.]|uniref:O-methyltransferase n=1 Tax=Nakamurella sp. TaxID=1869182 RepID=UPI003B3B284D
MTTSRSYADFFVPESEVVLAARARAADLGASPTGSGTAAALTFLASAIVARSVVEIGTGTGVSGLHLLAGMAPDGILTTIDIEAEYQRAAKKAFFEAGIAPTRTRLINGRALDVLPRLTDGAYDMVVVDGAPTEYPQYVAEALRLLRPGGVLVVDGALGGDKVADPTQRDADTVAVRDAGRLVRDDESLTAMLVPLGDGLLAAVKRW